MKLSRSGVNRGLGPATEIVGAGEDGLLACRRCVLGEGLCHQAEELQEEVIRLQHQRLQKEMDQVFSETLHLLEPKLTATLKEMAGRVCDYWFGKDMEGLEARDFWQQEEGSFSACISVTTG